MYLTTIDNNLTIEIYSPITNYEEYMLENIHFWLDGVTGSIVATVGFTLNSISIYILKSKKELRNVSTYLLLGLLLAQNIFLSTKILNCLYFDFKVQCLAVIIPYIVYPMEKVSMTTSVFLTVCLAHQGYTIISEFGKNNQASFDIKLCRKRIFYYMLSAIVCSLLFNIPRYFCYGLVVEDGHYKLYTLPFRKNFHFVAFYDNFVSNTLTVFAPITMLIFFNWNIYLFIVDHRQEMEDWDMDEQIRSQNKNHARVLLIIILIFIICHSPRCFLKFYDNFYDPLGIRVLGSLERMLLITHSSSNTIIYLIKNLKFRNYFGTLIHNNFCFHRSYGIEY